MPFCNLCPNKWPVWNSSTCAGKNSVNIKLSTCKISSNVSGWDHNFNRKYIEDVSETNEHAAADNDDERDRVEAIEWWNECGNKIHENQSGSQRCFSVHLSFPLNLLRYSQCPHLLLAQRIRTNTNHNCKLWQNSAYSFALLAKLYRIRFWSFQKI